MKLKIDGIGTVSDGSYEELTITGMATGIGRISADTIKVSGIFKQRDVLEVETLKVSGTANFQKAVYAGKVSVSGLVTVKEGNMEADEINISGVLNIKNELSADSVSVFGLITAGAIYGDTVKINNDKNLGVLVDTFGNHTPKCKVDIIEATNVQINGICSCSVKGHNITIGPNCIIGEVECSGELNIDPRATVKTIIR